MEIIVHLPVCIDVTDTNTTGKYTYIVALQLGKMTGDPDARYEDFQFIRADSEREAVEKYNKLNNCSYYYGEVIKRYN